MIRLRGPIRRSGVGVLAVHASKAVAGCEPGVVGCDVAAVAEPALPAIDVLARLALAARRSRSQMRLEHASPAILELVELCGLATVLPCKDHAKEAGASHRDPVATDASGGEVVR